MIRARRSHLPGPSLSLGPRALRALAVAWLALVWVSLWGDPSLGTAAAGVLVGWAVQRTVGGRTTPGSVQLHPLRALALAGVFLLMLVESTVGVVGRVLGPRIVLRSAVIDVALPPAPPAVATLVANAVTLTPGTLALDLAVADDESALLLVHALDAPDPETVRRDVLRLHALAMAAFGRSAPTSPPTPSSRSAP